MRIPLWHERSALTALAVLVVCAPATAAPRAGASKHAGGAATAPGIAASDTVLTFPAFSEALAALAPDSERVAEVASVQIARDAGVFVFEHGTLALCQPVAGATRAAVFTGHGTFLMSPPAGPERDQLERTYGRPALRRDFQTLVLLFSDSTLSELSQIASFHSGPLPKVMRETLRDLLPYLIGTDSHAPPPRLAKPLLDPVRGGLFLAAMASADGPLVFAIDPQQIESVELLRRPDNDRQGILVRHALEIVSRFRAAGDTLGLPASGDTRPPVRVRHASLDVSAGAELALRITAVLELEAEADSQRWLPFQLPAGAMVESASWEGGARAAHWSWTNSPILWVRCDPALRAGERRTLKVSYRSRTVFPVSDVVTNHVIDNSAAQGWYPRLGREDATTFEMAFHVPSHLQLMASGANVGEFTRGGVTTTRWSLERPVPFVSFEIGPFRRFDVDADSLPRLSVYLVDVHHSGRVESLSLARGAARTTEQQHAIEVAGEVQFLRQTLGPIPNLTLRAVEGTDEDIASTPQLVRLPSMFSSTLDAAVPPAFFRARELARQWWGIETRPASSHDAWLTEGLANFSAVWCVQSGSPGSGHYLGILESWRRQLIEQRDALPDRNTPPSPLQLGARLDEIPGSGTRPDGPDGAHLALQSAWVIHMLRGLMLDPEDPDERRFASLMRSFYDAHRGGVMSTGEFRAAAEQAAGRDLGWFFDQWVDHAAIPTYTFSYRVEQASDGRYIVHGRVKQSRVPPAFRMDVPVRIETASGTPERLRVQVSGPVTEFDLPPVSGKPARVVFNDLGAVLCEVIEAPWE